jgi:hypothetical protein
MKNIVRIFAIAMLLTGAFIGNTHATVKSAQIASKSAAPIPPCAPDEPTGCGIGNF